MYIISSNRLDQLSVGLAKSLEASRLGVFEKEVVLIQSKAMAKWLKLQIASQNGIVAQVDFLYLKEFISRVLFQLDLKVNESFWSTETMIWRIYKLLPKLEDSYSVLSNYIQNDIKRRHQLSIQIAGLFDEYMIYRSEWLLTWEGGEHAKLKTESIHHGWQMELWKRLCEEDQSSFHHALHRFHQLDKSNFKNIRLPKLISIFGISNMPGLFLKFFEKLSKVVPESELHFYYLSPCFEYWPDFKPKSNTFKRESQDDLPEFIRSYKKVKPYALLKSWGVLGRDFLNLLIEHTDFNTREFSLENDQDSQLAKVQNGILKLESYSAYAFKADDSIVIHACHNPIRELEVLKDHLKKLFKEDPLLKPHQIMVLCPDISKYSPYIKMVFETPHREWSELQKQIPFSISDQSIRQHSVLVSGFLKLLNLSKTRLVNQDVMDLLQIKEIRQSFEIEDEDLELINEWIKHAEIRWGRNAATRERDIGIAGFYQNSWEFGLERLMNGYAFDEELLYDESLSLPVGNDGLILGRLKRFMNHIYQLMDDFSTRQSTKVWSEILFGLLDVFIAKHDNNALERNVLVNAIQKLSDSWQVSSLTSELSSEMVIHSLESLLDEVSSTEGFLNRGVTFCAMLPMRSIPSKVVCLLGMNDGEFPRVDRRSGFDLMEKNWEQGDRSVRLNDRYIFLESLLSAQNVFYISYCGFNIKDNTVMEPSILVNELMQVLQEGENPFCIIHHPMHAYSPRYYNGELSSFSQKHFEMAMVLEGEKVAKKLICQEELSINEELQKNKVVSFQELINFFKHPSRYFLKYHLGTTFQTNELEELQKHEEFEPVTGLKKYNLKKEIHEKIKSGSAESLKQFYLATGRFSCGQKGELEIEQILDNMAQYQEQLLIDENDADERKLAVKINFDSTEFSIEGEIERVFENSYIPYSYSQDSPSKRLFELIPFLILSAGVGIREMKLHFSNKKLVLQSELTDQAKEDLRLLLDLYLEGLSKPLPFFPKGFEAFHGVMKSKGSEIGKAEAAARKKWLDSSSKNPQKPEGEDEVFKLCFGDLFPGDHPDFSERVWSTMKMLSDLLNRYSWSELK